MYETNGAFGRVRLAELMEPMQHSELFSVLNLGWHCCNDLYRYHRPNGSDKHLLLFTIRGEGFLHLKNQQYTLSAGSIALLPRGEAHTYGTPPGGLWEFYWIHPTGAAADFLDKMIKDGGMLSEMEQGFAYAERMEEMLALCTERPLHFEWKLSQKLSELLHHMAMRFCMDQEEQTLSRKLIQLMETGFAEKFTLEEAAKKLYVSPAHLIRVFRREMHCTPHWYLTQYRLMQAEQLLRFGTQTIAQIAQNTGFSSASHFISQFKQARGCTPEQFRQSSASWR